MIGADYETAPGVHSATANFEPTTKAHYWMDYREGEGWVPVRDLSEAELWCLRYLQEFPPVYDGLRT